MQETVINKLFSFYFLLKKLTATPGQSSLGTRGEKNDDSRNFCIEKCRKIVKLNSAWSMSKCQVKASYATIVIKFSSLEYPLLWRADPPPISNLFMTAILHWGNCFPSQASPSCHLLCTSSIAWTATGEVAYAKQAGRAHSRSWGDANPPTPFSSTSGLNWPWSQVAKRGDGSLHRCLFSF